MKRVRDILNELEKNRGRVTMWEEIVEYLVDFVPPSDDDEEPNKTAYTARGKVVECGIIEEIIMDIEKNFVTPLHTKIRLIGDMEVVSDEEAKSG